MQAKLRITDINDHCLLAICSVKSLSLMDLCSLAETCTRFQQIIRRTVPKGICIYVNLNQSYDVESEKYLHSTNLPHDDIERIFKYFGPFLSAIDICDEPSLFLLNMVTEYCVNTLDSLTIIGSIGSLINIPAVLAVKLKPIFKRLQRLDIGNVTDKTLFAECASLTDLKFNDEKNCGAILGSIFPKLEQFSYTNLEFDEQALINTTTFFLRHTSLKTLVLNIPFVKSGRRVLLEVIGNSCKELKELSLNMWFRNPNTRSLQSLQGLRSLSTLHLICSPCCPDLKFVSTLTKLRELHLCSYFLPKDFSQFDLLSQLKTLIIEDNFPGAFVYVVDIVRRLINLQEFTVLKENFVLDEETFSKIVATVKCRPNILTLKCKFNFVLNLQNCGDNHNVRLLMRPNRQSYYDKF